MNLKKFGIYLLTAMSITLFIRASIVPIFVVYGDPLDEMYVSLLSLAFVLLAFVLVVKRGSFLVGSSLLSIGAFYIYNGNKMLALVFRDMEYIPYPAGMINANIITMTVGVAILGCGIFAILQQRVAEKRNTNVRAPV